MKRHSQKNGSTKLNSEPNNNYNNGVSNKSQSTKVSMTETVEKQTGGRIWHFFCRTLVPSFIIVSSPNLAILLWFTTVKCNGSFSALWQMLTEHGYSNGILKIWLDIHIASPLSVAVIGGYMLWALILMILVPGPRSTGPVTPKGNTPIYKDNGFACYVITMAVFACLAWYLKSFTGYSVTIVYDHFDEFLGTLTVYSHGVCIFLYFKGIYFPSSSDSGPTGNPIYDYYCGTELHPRIFGLDIKVFTNCRFGMTVWSLLVCIFTLKNFEMYGFVDSTWVSATLQTVYFLKFFWWESGYMGTIDIMLDGAGYMICWGCIAFIPGMYASVSMYLASRSTHLGFFWSVVILLLGVICCVVNYLADRQKQRVRKTKGNCKIWGKKPKVIHADYVLENGEVKTNVLLASGFWGISRHFHYIPELGLAFLWTLPSLFQHVLPYTYFIFLFVLLLNRTYRDNTKCSKKYTKHWNEYCEKVPYKMIPYIF